MKFHGVEMQGVFTNQIAESSPFWATQEDEGRLVYYSDELYLGDSSKFKKIIDEDNLISSNILAPIGSIIQYAGASVPNSSWMFCNGAELDPAQYPEIYAIIGTTYGSGTGTFKLPDLRRKFVWGVGNNIDLGETGGDETTDTTHSHNIFDHAHYGGPHTHEINHSHGIVAHSHTVANHVHGIPGETLSVSQMPSHRHGPSNLARFGSWNGGAAAGHGAISYGYTSRSGGGGSHNHTGNTSGSNPSTTSVSQNTDQHTGNSGQASGNTGGMTGTTGTSNAGENVLIIPPYIGLNFIIRVK